MSKILPRGCLRFSYDFLCLMSCLEVFLPIFCCLPTYPGPVSNFLLSNNSADFVILPRSPLLTDGRSNALHLHMFLSQLQVSLYETVTTQFQQSPSFGGKWENLWSTFSAKLRRIASSTNASHRILFCLFWSILCIRLDEASRNLHKTRW